MNQVINEKRLHWESLINNIDKSDIPIEFVNSIVIELHTPLDGSHEKDIDVKSYRAQGYSDSLIEEIVQATFNDYNNNIKSMDFFLDIDYVANTVQHETDILLEQI